MNENKQIVDPLPTLMSIEEAAKRLGLKRATAYRYAAAGELPVKRFGRRVYVVRAELVAEGLLPEGEVA